MSNMTKVAKNLKKALDDSDKRKPNAYDTEAEVVGAEDNSLWVKFPGGETSTPIRKTMDAKPGDKIMVRVSGHRAWAVGNETSPPTDDTRANAIAIAAQPSIDYVRELVDKDVTVRSISVATGYIDDLHSKNITTDNLQATTGYIEDLTSENITAQNIVADHEIVESLDANYAHISNGIIDNAKIGYADIQDLNAHYAQIDIANVNNAWIESGAIKKAEVFDENVFDLSGDHATLSRIDASKINVANLRADNLVVRRINGQPVVGGYTLIDSNSPGYSSKNPQALGWYEFVNAQWVLSTDTTVDMTKAYYQEGNEVSLYDQAYIDGLEDDLQQQIDGAVETFTGSVVPTLTNYPYTDWYDTSVTPIHDERAKHVGDIYYVVNSASDENGYCYRFAYDNTSHAYSWVLIKDSDVTKALSDISDLQTFESETTSWIDETDEGLETIRTNHTALSGVVDKTVKSTVQLWFTKANTTAPSKPTSHITSTSTSGNAWRTVVPVYNASYPYYYYCYEHLLADGTYIWSDVVRDVAMEESQSTSRTAKSTADANIKSTVQLWFTKADTTAPDAPTAHVTSTSTSGNAWRTVVPSYNASYPYYYYCYEYQKGDNSYAWSAVVRDRAMEESQSVARAALPASTFTSFESTTFKDVKDTVTEHSATFTNMTTRLGMNSDGTGANTDVVAKESALEQTVDGISTRVGKTETKLIGMYATSSTAEGTRDKVATITPALPSDAPWELSTGTMVTVKFTKANTYAATSSNPLRLNVNGKGLKPIKTYANDNLSEAEYKWKAGDTFTFTYNGTNWLMQDSTVATRMTSAESSITQNANNIELKVSKDGVISSINQSAESVTINADKVNIEGAAIFTGSGRLSSTSLDAAYDANGAASTAQANAISTAAADATSKANTAESNAKSYADTGIISTTTLYYASNSTTAPSKPSAHVTTNSASTYGAWNIALPTYSATYPYLYICTETKTKGGTYAWTSVEQTTYSSAISAIKTTADGAAPKSNAVSRSQRIYYRKTSSGAPSANTTWLSTSGTGYGNWSLSIPQLTSGTTKYPYLYTAVQTQTVSQQAAGNTCSCSTVLLDDTTTVIDGGTIITGTVNANAVNASSGTFDTANIPNLNASKITAGDISADRMKTNSISAINGNTGTVKISASKVEIDGTATFNAIKASADAAYDSKGSASAVQTNLDNLEIGGRNLLLSTGTANTWTLSLNSSNYQVRDCYQTCLPVPSLFAVDDLVTISFDWSTTGTSGNFRLECGKVTPYTWGTVVNAVGTRSATSNYVDITSSNKSGHVSVTFKITSSQTSAAETLQWFRIRVDGADMASKTFTVSNAKAERGNKATDWTPAPEDVDATITTVNNKATAYRGTLNTRTDGAITVNSTGFVLATGATISVYFNGSSNYAGKLTLNVNSTGAKDVWVGDLVTSDTNRLLWHYGSTITFTYDGTRWRVVDAPGTFYGSTCSTAAGTAAKVTNIPSGVIFRGCTIEAPMSNANTSTSAALHVGNSANDATALTGNILYGTGSTVPTQSNGYSWLANMSVIFKYDGKYWRTGNQTIIDGGHILTGTISADRIGADSITANKIAANSIGAKHLSISDTTNLVQANELNSASLSSSTSIVISDGYLVKSNASTIQYMYLAFDVPNTFKAGDEFYYELTAKGAATGTVSLNLYGYTSSSSYVTGASSGIALTTSDVVYKGTIKLPSAWDDTVAKYRIAINDGRSTKSQVYLKKVSVRRKSAGELIVDGSITADKIAIGTNHELENILLDSDAPTMTKVEASADRYFSDSGSSEIVCSNFTLTDAPEEGWVYGRRFVYDGSVATNNYLRAYAFYNNANGIPLTPNKTYTATWWARCTSGSGRTSFYCSKGDGATGKLSSPTWTLTRAWKKYTYSFTFGSTLNTDYNRLWFRALFPTSTAGTVEICGCKLVAGADAESYITRINDAGIRIHPSSTENNSVVINADGMEVFKGGTGSANSVAFYGDTARVGAKANSKTRVELSNTAMNVISRNSSGTDVTIASFGSTVTIGATSAPNITINGDGVFMKRANGTTLGSFSTSSSNGEVILYGSDPGGYCKLNYNYIEGKDVDGLTWRLGPDAVRLNNGTIACDQFDYSGFYFNQNVNANGWVWAKGGNVQAGVYNSTGGFLISAANGNQVTIGSQNAGFCHIYNSANVGFAFNNYVCTTNAGSLGTTTYPWGYVITNQTLVKTSAPTAHTTAYTANWYQDGSLYYLSRPTSSSRRYKRDIVKVRDSKLDPHKLYDIPVVQFRYTDGYLSADDPYNKTRHNVVGFIAEDIDKHYPIAAIKVGDEVDNWNERYIIPPMLALIQEQHEDIEKLKDEINNLKGAN